VVAALLTKPVTVPAPSAANADVASTVKRANPATSDRRRRVFMVEREMAEAEV